MDLLRTCRAETGRTERYETGICGGCDALNRARDSLEDRLPGPALALLAPARAIAFGAFSLCGALPEQAVDDQNPSGVRLKVCATLPELLRALHERG